MILTTSQLLTTGVNAEMVKYVALARVIGSHTEFKQLIGRGTCLKVDYGKEYFLIIGLAGTATRHLADRAFDGEPARIEEVTVDGSGDTVDTIGKTPPLVAALDESAFGKKGKMSAGVARQRNGRLEKVDNWQVGVFAAVTRDGLASVVDAKPYLPETWASDAACC